MSIFFLLCFCYYGVSVYYYVNFSCDEIYFFIPAQPVYIVLLHNPKIELRTTSKRMLINFYIPTPLSLDQVVKQYLLVHQERTKLASQGQ